MQTQWKTLRWSGSFGVLLVALAAMLIASPLASAHGKQSKISFSGRAFVVEVDTLLGTTFFVDTGALPASGGTLRASLSSFNDNESGTQITAHTLRASISGEGNGTHGVASLDHLVIDDGMGNVIKATVVRARAEAKCVAGQVRLVSRVHITNLTINGIKQTITGATDQTIVVPGTQGSERLLINDVFSDEATGTITVRALEFIQFEVQGFTFATVTADVSNCPPRK